MAFKSYRQLFCVLLLFAELSASAQSTKIIILKGVDSLPAPPPPQTLSFFLTVSEEPEIIATAEAELDDQYFRTNAIVASYLGKGKILSLATPTYFAAEMLTKNSVKQFLSNAISWAKPGNIKRTVAVGQTINKGLVDFLRKQDASVYTTVNYALKKNTNVLILDRDVTDSRQLQLIEDFIRSGGTLIFASPYPYLYANKSTVKDLKDLDLGINKVLAKSGVINLNGVLVSSEKYKTLATDSVPAYLQLKSALIATQKQQKFNESGEFLMGLTFENSFKYNDPNSAIVKHMKQVLQLPSDAAMPVPSPLKPVLNNTAALKIANKAMYDNYAKEQHFSTHPQAKAIGYQVFPGAVTANAPRITHKLDIPVRVGSQGYTDNLIGVQSRLHSTGLYVPAGETVTIRLSGADTKHGLVARIGVHDDNVTNLDQFTRIPVSLTKEFKLKQQETKIYSPYGGLLLISTPDTCTLSHLTITVTGAVKAPYFRLGVTDEKEWIASIRNNPGPWAELATDNLVLTVPSYRIRNLNNPVKLMQFWDDVMNADADLAAMPRKRKHQERIIIDNDVAYGYMFTTLDKIMAPNDQSCEWMLNEQFIRNNGSWGTFHELGHRHQYWPFEDWATQEVTVNLYTMYVYDKVLHQGMYHHEGMESRDEVIAKIKAYLSSTDKSYTKWGNDPFLALAMYIQIVDVFGWDIVKTVNATYRNTSRDEFPKNAQEKIDFRFVTLCKATQSNLSRFFEVWHIPVSTSSKKLVEAYKEWFPKELAAYK